MATKANRIAAIALIIAIGAMFAAIISRISGISSFATRREGFEKSNSPT